MTPKERAAMQQALEALETDEQWGFVNKKVLERRLPAITALREALVEQAEQEPFDMDDHPPHRLCECRKCMEYFTPLPDCDAHGNTVSQEGCVYCNSDLFAGTKCNNCGRVVAQPVSQEYQDHLANQSFDWSAMAAKHQFMEGYRIGLAEMREKCAKVVTEHAPTCSPHWVSYVVAIRAIKFEGDTGFRPVSEMIAEHEQDPKKAAAIEKAKMRKVARAEKIAMPGVYEVPVEQAEQEPVGFQAREIGEGDWFDVGLDEIARITGIINSPILDYRWIYAAPVRTKDLTDEELNDMWYGNTKDGWLGLFRAVIAADREKNYGNV